MLRKPADGVDLGGLTNDPLSRVQVRKTTQQQNRAEQSDTELEDTRPVLFLNIIIVGVDVPMERRPTRIDIRTHLVPT